MAKFKITSDLVNSIVKQDHSKYLKNINKNINQVLALSIDALSKKVSYINVKNVLLQPVNELITNSFVDNSGCVYFLGIDNAQLELNTMKKTNIWRNFKERLKYAWSARKLFKRRRRRSRRKRELQQIEELSKVKFDPSKYSIYNLAEDLQTSMCNNLSETTILSLKDSKISIIGKEDFGSNTEITIYLVSHNEQSFKYFSANKRGFIEVNINSRLEQISLKLNDVGDNFNKLLKIFNTLYYNVNGHMPNQVYLESLLCAVPNELFDGMDIYKVFLKVINFLKVKSIRNIQSINDMTKNINEDIVCGNCGIEFNKLFNLI